MPPENPGFAMLISGPRQPYRPTPAGKNPLPHPFGRFESCALVLKSHAALCQERTLPTMNFAN